MHDACDSRATDDKDVICDGRIGKKNAVKLSNAYAPYALWKLHMQSCC